HVVAADMVRMAIPSRGFFRDHQGGAQPHDVLRQRLSRIVDVDRGEGARGGVWVGDGPDSAFVFPRHSRIGEAAVPTIEKGVGGHAQMPAGCAHLIYSSAGEGGAVGVLALPRGAN